MTASPKVLAELTRIDATLERAGAHSASPFWLAQRRRFYSHKTARVLVACVGRGGVKTGESVRQDIAETLAGEFDIPRGEVHFHTRVCENVEEGAKTLSILEQYLRLLKIRFTRAGNTIELRDSPRGFKVLACRVGAVSGWRSFGWTADECAKWRDADTGANPAHEVIASIRAMTVTHPNARGRMVSSPLATAGYFYDRWTLGNTRSQLVCHAPTWIANPSITEAQTRELEPDERVRRREYMAEAQAGALGAFDPERVTAAFGRKVEIEQTGKPVLILDPSSGRKDAWTWAIVRWVQCTDGVRRLEFADVDGLSGKFWNHADGNAIVERLARVAREWKADHVHSDQRESLMLKSAFKERGLVFVAHDWTSRSKEEGVARVRRWLADGTLLLPPKHEQMRNELLAFEERIAPSGAFTFGARGSGHDDYVALIITAALADMDHRIKRPGTASPASGGTPAAAVQWHPMPSIDDLRVGGGYAGHADIAADFSFPPEAARGMIAQALASSPHLAGMLGR